MTAGAGRPETDELLPSHWEVRIATVAAKAINKNATANNSSRNSRRRR